MKKLSLLFLGLFCVGSLCAQDNLSALLPMPNHYQLGTAKKCLELSPQTLFSTNLPAESYCVKELERIFQRRMNLSLKNTSSSKATVQLLIDSTLKGSEHYTLSVTDRAILIKGATEAAVQYGVMTLDQLLIGDLANTKGRRIAPIQIDDQPRMGYRALMLDPARHFIPVADLKFFIDQMVRYKYNTLQLHLTDNQSWRMEIKSHPELTRDGAFYTQQELQEIIRYAAARHVEIIPELDVPGHTIAILKTHPELGCVYADSIARIPGKTNTMLCANNDAVYELYKEIIPEVAALFPSRYIHLGGDESQVARNWAICKKCQALMAQKGYKKPEQLMNYFFSKFIPMVRECGKQTMMWCEFDTMNRQLLGYLFDYPQDVVLFAWHRNSTAFCIEQTAKHGNQLVMSPSGYTYMDYPQALFDFPERGNWGMPMTTLEMAYAFDPGNGLPEEEQSHIIGMNGALWGEALFDINRLTYMAFPRSLALAEAGWTTMKNRSWESFKQRVFPNLYELMRRGVSVRVPFEIVSRELEQ